MQNPNETPDTETLEEEIEQTVDEVTDAIVEAQAEPKTPTVAGIMKALRAAVQGGQITSRQASEMRRQLGIQKSLFTKKQLTKAQRKKRRVMQREGRRQLRKSMA